MAGMATDRSPAYVGAGIVLALVLISCAAASAPRRAEAQAAAPATPAEAVARFVVARGVVYAGDCSVTRSPEDVGKVCSKLAGERPSLRAYLIGRTFSEFDRWVFVRLTPSGWQVEATAPLDFFDTGGSVPWPA